MSEGGGSERRQDLETNYDGDDLLNFQFLKLMNLSEIKCLVVVVGGGFWGEKRHSSIRKQIRINIF